ncbi:MAG TPA: hypothetical protein VN787_03515 [Steroidobacteraceae bacterium]|nr:hypothetical protein [Steroidobacteraceae bacterium]
MASRLMSAPFYMLTLLHLPGEDSLVWDQATEFEYLTAGRGTVSAEFGVEAAEIAPQRAPADGSKLLPEFLVEIRDRNAEVLAGVRNRLYVRRKKRSGAVPVPAG